MVLLAFAATLAHPLALSLRSDGETLALISAAAADAADAADAATDHADDVRLSADDAAYDAAAADAAAAATAAARDAQG